MRDKPPAMPLWVKGFIAVLVILVLLVLSSMLLGVRHGPGQHSSAQSPRAAIDTMR
jgi:hypothetical protein